MADIPQGISSSQGLCTGMDTVLGADSLKFESLLRCQTRLGPHERVLGMD